MSTLQSCLLCGADTSNAVCVECQRDCPALAEGCPQCADVSIAGERCGRCLHSPPAFDRVIAPYVYDFPVDQLLQSLKYQGRLLIGHWLGKQLAPLVSSTAASCIVPMPLHEDRLRARGFNQALEIAYNIAKRTGFKLRTHDCIRTRGTRPQAELALAERPGNLRNAFHCVSSFDGAHVLLVDDVMTTGSTLHECAKALKQAGATQVTAVVAARALRHPGH